MAALRLRLSQLVLAAALAVAASAAETAPAPRAVSPAFSGNPRGEPLLFETNATLIRPGTVNWWSVSVSPDAKWIATAQGHGDTKGEVNIWDREKGTVKHVIAEPKGVRTVAFSPDATTLATGNYDSTVRFYDAASFKLLAASEESSGGHKGGVNGLCFFKKGKYLATAGLDKTVRIWDVAAIGAKSKNGAAAARPVAIFEGHTQGVLSVSVSADGLTLLSGSFDRTARCYDVPDPLPAMGEPPVVVKKERVLLQGHNLAVEAVAVSPDGQLLATGSWDAQVLIRDRDGKKTEATVGFSMGVMCLAFSKDGKQLAIGTGVAGTPDRAGELRVWDVVEKKQAASRADYPSAVLGVAFAPDGKTVASVGPDRALHQWQYAEKEKDRQTFTAPGPSFAAQPYLAGTLSSNGELLAVSGEGKSVFVLNRIKGSFVAELTGHEDVVAGLAFSPDGKTLATASYDKTIKLWNTETWKERKTLAGHTGWVLGVAFAPDSRTLATGSYDKTVRLWNSETGEPVGTWKDHTAGVRSVAFSPTGERLVSAGSDRTVRIWKVEDGSVLRSLKGHKSAVRAVAFSPDGKTVASGSEDKSVKLWDAETGQEKNEFAKLPDMVTALQFSPKGQSIAVATFQGPVVILDPLSGHTRQTLRAHNEPVSAVAFADDGQKLISISQDRTMRQWPAVKPASVAPAQSLAAKPGLVSAAAFEPNGTFAAFGQADGSIFIWDWRTGGVQSRGSHPGGVAHLAVANERRIASIGKDETLRVGFGNGKDEWTGKGQYAAFTPDGKHLAVAEGRDIVLRQAATGSEVKRFAAGHDGNVLRFAFSPDGAHLISAGDDTKLRLWKVADGSKQQETPAFGNYSTIAHVAFSPDGTRFAAAAFGPDQPPPEDMTGNFRVTREVRVYTVPPAEGTFANPIVFSPQPNDQPITGLDWTANGQSLVMAASDGTVRVNELAANAPRETLRFRAHDASILAAAFSLEAGTYITAGEDLAVKRWRMPGLDPAPGQARVTPQGLTRFWQMLPSPDGKYFVGAGEGDKTFRVYSAMPAPIPVEPDRHGSIYSLCFSPDNQFFVTGHDKGAIVVREAGTGKTLRVLTGMKKRVLSIGFAEKGAALVAVGGNIMNGEEPGEAVIWDFAKDTVRHTLEAPVLQWMAAVHPNGKSFAAAGNDGSVRIWDVGTGKLEKELTKGPVGGLYCVAYDSTGQRIATGVYGSRVRIWDVAGEKVLQEIRTNKDLRPSQVLFSPDGKEIVVSLWRGNGPDRKPEIAAYTIGDKDAAPRLFPTTHPASVTNIAFLPDGKTLVASGGEDKGQGSVRAYDFATGKPLGIFTGHRNWGQSLAVSSDGKVASTSWGTPVNGELRLWDARGIRPIAEVKVPGEKNYLACGGISKDGKLLVLGGWGQTLTAWDMSNPAKPVLKKDLKGHAAGLRYLAFDAAGTRFATADETGIVKVWDARSLDLIVSFKASPVSVYRVRFTPDGTRLVTASGNYQTRAPGEIKVWDPMTGKETGRFPEQPREIWDILFLNGGKHLAVIHVLTGAPDDANLKIWDFERKEVVRSVLPAGTFSGGRCLGVSPDGRRLAIGSTTGPVKVLNTETWQEEMSIPDLTNCTFGVEFTRDGRTLVIASGEGAGIAVRMPTATP